jgi:putative ABC transport system permease protein
MYIYAFSMLGVLGFVAAVLGPILAWEKGRRSLGLALRSLRLHKLRAFLSVLGIIIGTAAVISLMAFGEGSMQDALDDIKRMGATNIIVRSVKPPDDSVTARRTRIAIYGLTYDDYDRFLTNLGTGTVTRVVPMRVFRQEIRRLERMHNGRVVGTTPEYAEVNQLDLACGRFLHEEDDLRMRNVCVLGSTTAEKLFPFENPLGQTVRLGQHFYVIVGALRERMPTGGSGGSQAAENYNDDVYIPINTCQRRFGERIVIRQTGAFNFEQVQLHQITLTVSDIDKVRPAGEVIRKLLTNHLKHDTDVTVPLDRLEEAERAKTRYELLLATIASISLLVGGIGIMNIMLATVTERTREIGIRRALGAKRRDITLQFLIEAVVQTTIGGVVGAFIGLAIVFGFPRLVMALWGTNWPAKVHVPSIFIALAVALIVGVGFGLYPAYRASRLDPIEALRHE